MDYKTWGKLFKMFAIGSENLSAFIILMLHSRGRLESYFQPMDPKHSPGDSSDKHSEFLNVFKCDFYRMEKFLKKLIKHLRHA